MLSVQVLPTPVSKAIESLEIEEKNGISILVFALYKLFTLNSYGG